MSVTALMTTCIVNSGSNGSGQLYNISKKKCGIYPRSYGSSKMGNATLFGLEMGVIV